MSFSQDLSVQSVAPSLPVKSGGEYTLGTAEGNYANDAYWYDSLAVLFLADRYYQYFGKEGGGVINYRFDTLAIFGPNERVSMIGSYFAFQGEDIQLLDGSFNRLAGPFEAVHVLNSSGYRVWKDGKCGILDDSLRTVIPVRFDQAGPYINGFLTIDDNKLGYFEAGEEVMKPEYEHVSRVYDQRLVKGYKDGRWHYFSQFDHHELKYSPENGDSLILMPYGVYKVVNGGLETVYNTSNGELIIRSSNLKYYPISMEYLASHTDSLVGLIHRNGTTLFKPKFHNIKVAGVLPWENLGYKINDRLIITMDHQQGLADTRGNVILKCEYDRVVYANSVDSTDFYYIVADRKVGLADHTGKIYLEPGYSGISVLQRGIAYLRRGFQYGLYNYRTERINLPVEYSDIDGLSGNYFRAKMRDKFDVSSADSVVVRGCLTAHASSEDIVKCYRKDKLKVMELNDSGWVAYDYQKMPSYIVQDTSKYESSLRVNGPPSIYYHFDVLTESWGSKNTYSAGWNVRPYAQTVYKDNLGRLQVVDHDIAKKDFTIGELDLDVDYQLHELISRHKYLSTERMHANANLSGRKHELMTEFDESGKQKMLGVALDSMQYAGQINMDRRAFNVDGEIELVREETEESLHDYYHRINVVGNMLPATMDDYRKIISDSFFVKVSGGQWSVMEKVPSYTHDQFWTASLEFDYIDNRGQRFLIYERNKKYGLMNDSGFVQVNAVYDTIIPQNSWNNFYVSIPSRVYRTVDIYSGDTLAVVDSVRYINKEYFMRKGEAAYQLVDYCGDVVYESTQSFRVFNDTIMRHSIGEHACLVHISGDTLISAPSDRFKKVNDYLVLNEHDKMRTLYKLDGEELANLKYGKTTVYDSVVVFHKRDVTYFYNSEGNQLYKLKGSGYEYLSGGKILVESKEEYFLYDILKGKKILRPFVLGSVYDGFFSVDGGDDYTLYNFTGKELDKGIDRIGYSREGYLTARLDDEWNLYHRDRGFVQNVDDEFLIAQNDTLSVYSGGKEVHFPLAVKEEPAGSPRLTGWRGNRKIVSPDGNVLHEGPIYTGTLHGDVAYINDPALSGVLNAETNEFILPPLFSSVRPVTSYIYEIRIGSRVGYVDSRGKYLWELCD